MRKGKVERNTKETKISCEVNLDGVGQSKISTQIGFFDHMLELLSCLLYTSPSPRDCDRSRMPSSA